MFRKITDLTDRISSAAQAVINTEDPMSRKVRTLEGMGFESHAASQALEATNGDVDRAAELLLVRTGAPPESLQSQPSDNETLERVLQESVETENRRRRTAAMRNAGEAAIRRAAKEKTGRGKKTPPKARKGGAPPKVLSGSGGLTTYHPDVKLIPKLQDKSKEEQILRCADRLKSSPNAVDTLLRALSAVQKDPDNPKFRKIDKTNAGYQRSLANAPGAEDMLRAMNFRTHGADSLVLDRAMLDSALLYLGVSALEQTKQSLEYKQGKRRIAFAKEVQEIQMSVNSSEAEALKRAEHMAKCPTEPPSGRGALLQVVMADQTVRRRFDGDDVLQDVLNWLGGHGAAIPAKILSREWSLVDLNRYPVIPIDCQGNLQRTLQYIGCWPSGRMEIVPSTEEWMQNGTLSDVQRGSARGLAAAPADAL